MDLGVLIAVYHHHLRGDVIGANQSHHFFSIEVFRAHSQPLRG